MNLCFMVTELMPNGGGNIETVMEDGMIVRRTAAIGDVLCATIIADKLAALGHAVQFQSHLMIHCVLRRCRNVSAISTPNGYADIDLDGAYERDPQRRVKHFHQMFFDRANEQLRRSGINLGPATNCKPRLTMRDHEKAGAAMKFKDYPKPWVFICPRSESYAVRRVADGLWQEICQRIAGTKFWIGMHPAPPGIVDLNNRHFDNVMTWLSVADLLITVDTGPMHVAAALGIPIVAIGQSSSPALHLNDQTDYIEVNPKLNCLNCQLNLCPINEHIPPCNFVDPDLVASWANARLSGAGKVSAVIPTFNASADRLNRCISSVVNQVNEVIVSVDNNGKLPADAMQHPKVKYIHRRWGVNSFGRNCNYAARHTNGEFLWFVNDDFFAEPNCVVEMLKCMAPDVGLVGHLIKYPDGRICHAGKHRALGARGWSLLNNRQFEHDIKQPVEQENVTGTSMLARRKAHYEIDGWDEDFLFYAEDDAYSLQMRRAGWKIFYTPLAWGTHMEAASTSTTGKMEEWNRWGNQTFERKWGFYLDANINRPGLGVFP